MRSWGIRAIWIGGLTVIIGASPLDLRAGGSGLNTAVIINQSSSNSLALGNYFCERRQVPPDNVLFMNWPGGNISWTNGDFQTNLLNPLLAMLAARQLTNQIDYVVLSMDIPFQTINGSAINGTTSALFYGLKSNTGPDWLGSTNSYAASEQVFRQAPPASAPGYSFLTTMLTGYSLAQAEQLVDQGVNSDASFPTAPVVLAKSSDPLRNIRYTRFDNAIFNTRLCGDYFVERTNSDSPSGQSNLLGYETGLANLGISANTFVPGAMADSLTSFGGIIFGPNGQTTALDFTSAGAAGSYGTVVEPSPSLDKFPDPQAYFYQARGFSLAECYYQSLNVPYEGLIVGEPLAAPFAHPASGQWTNISGTLSGTAQLALQFSASDSQHPLQQIDLFVDGKYFQTLTNLGPQAGNVLTVTVKGFPLSYTVGNNETLSSEAAGLAALINSPTNPNSASIAATAYGDRIELHALPTNSPATVSLLGATTARQGTPALTQSGIVPPLAGSFPGTAPSLSAFLAASRSTFLNSQAFGLKACTVNGSLQTGSWLQVMVTKTNGVIVSLAVTNQPTNATLLDLAGQLTNLINSTSALQGLDGLVAEDLGPGFFGSAAFTLRALGPGHRAAALQAQLAASAGLVVTPNTQVGLNDNLADLQPRNHIYIRAGATNFALSVPLDTTLLADGFHDLAAVAYEGSNVRTQTRITLPVVIQNSPLSASLSLLDLGATAPVQGTYHIGVVANTNNVNTITLFSTGGALGTIANQSSATFLVNGPSLGVGLHPFYAVVQTTAGSQYRTQAQSARLVTGN